MNFAVPLFPAPNRGRDDGCHGGGTVNEVETLAGVQRVAMQGYAGSKAPGESFSLPLQVNVRVRHGHTVAWNMLICSVVRMSFA